MDNAVVIYAAAPRHGRPPFGKIALKAAAAAALALCAGGAIAAGRGMIVLQVGSDWCESGECVRKVFESSAFRQAVRRDGFNFAVYDDMENPTPKALAANKALDKQFIPSKRYPAISFVAFNPSRFFAMLENIPYDITAQELAAQVNAAMGARKEAEALFKTGVKLRMSNPQEAANAYGRGFEILSGKAGEFNERLVWSGDFAYKAEWQMLAKLDSDDRYGWRRRFEIGYGFDLVKEANKFREYGDMTGGQKYIASLRRIPAEHLTVVQRQCIDMAEYALLRSDDAYDRKAADLLKHALSLGRNTVWGQCAMGYLILSGESVERRPPRRADVRPRPAREAQRLIISANALKGRLSQIGAKDELTEEQKTDIARYAMLRRVGLEGWNELAGRPGARPFMADFLKDRLWMEDFAWSGPCDPQSVFALESLVFQDNGRWIDGPGPGRRFATAVALEYPHCDEAWLADYLDAYRETALAKRLHRHALEQPVWQWRHAVARRGSMEADDPPNQQRFMDKFCNMTIRKYGRAHCFVPYRRYNCFGELIHSRTYYEPWVTAGEWPKRRYSYLVGGVCGELSTFGSICAGAHGIASIPCGQPGHCAFIYRRLDGTWKIGNYVSPPTTMRCYWPDVNSWTYLQANEGTFEGDRERRHDANRFSELARFAERRHRPAEEVAAFHARACRAWSAHYDAWRSYGEWLARADRPAEERRSFIRAAAAAMKGWRQPLWDLLSPHIAHVMEKEGAAALAATLAELAPSLRQSDAALQEEGDFKTAVSKWTKPIAENDACMETVAKAFLSAQAGTRDYLAQTLAWCGDFMVKDEKRLSALMASLGKKAPGRKSKAAPGGKSRPFLAPLILSAAAAGNIPVFKRLSALNDRLVPRRPPGKRYPARDFGAELISDGGLLRISSSAISDTPERHAHALDTTQCTGSTFHTEKEGAPWAMVLLPQMSIIKGIVVVNKMPDDKGREQQIPLVIEVSDDGQNWQKVFSDGTPREIYRVDLTKNKLRSICVRVSREPGEKDEPFSLGKILVYGK